MRTSETDSETVKWPSFWKWWVFGYGTKPGYRLVFTKFLILDTLLAVLVFLFLGNQLDELSPSFASIFSIIFLGLAISSSATGVALSGSKEIIKLAHISKGGISDYLFPLFVPMFIMPIPFIGWHLWEHLSYESLLFPTTSITPEIYLSDIYGITLLTFSFLAVRIGWAGFLAPANLIIAISEIKKVEGENGTKLD
ncbi:MAG: hypothetical protein JKY60_17875 [Kordiimonadaceae bacterium]|nr:hypothetical protein [Kordiimonadaceae bacterium]